MFLFFTLVPVSVILAQENRLNEYLNALQAKELEASKETISRTSFGLPNEYSLYSYGIPDGKYFDTDIPGVKGYKATIACTAKDGQQHLITDTFLVIMYYDHIKSLWRVFDLRILADPCYEAIVSQDDVDKDNFYTDKEYVYRNLGYWHMMCGNMGAADIAYHLSSTEAKAKGLTDFVDIQIEIIKSIR